MPVSTYSEGLTTSVNSVSLSVLFPKILSIGYTISTSSIDGTIASTLIVSSSDLGINGTIEAGGGTYFITKRGLGF